MHRKLVPLLLTLACAFGATAAAAAEADAKEAQLPFTETPPEGARHISFAADAVTWLSLDVAPDGGRIVFEALGDLYIVSAQGGQAVPLTRGMAFDSQPAWSPNGKHIAFLSDRDGSENLWIIPPEGGAAKKLSTGGARVDFASPSWAPDSSHVVVSRTSWGLRTFELWAYHLGGGKGVQITKAKKEEDTPRNSRANALGAVYSRDGKYLYYARKDGGFNYNLTFPQWQIVRRELTTGVEDTITNAQGSAFRPRLSRDGKLLAYATRRNGETALRLRDLNAGTDKLLLQKVERDEQESRFTRDLLPGYSFTPDGQHIIISREGKMQRVPVALAEYEGGANDSAESDNSTITIPDITVAAAAPAPAVQTIPVTLQITQTIGPSLYAPYRLGGDSITVRLARNAAISPDGTRVAFSALGRIYVHDFASGANLPITTPNISAFQPAWDSDSQHIAYVTWGADGGHIWRARAAPIAAPERLTKHAAYYRHPVFSPDGHEVFALRATAYERRYREYDYGEPVGSEIIRMLSRKVPGVKTTLQVVAPSRGLGPPHFGPEKGRVYAAGEEGLISMRFDGSDRRNIVQVKGPGIYRAEKPVPAADIRLSPKGTHALALHANQLYLVGLINRQLQEITVELDAPVLPIARLTDVGADDFGWSADGGTVHWSAGNQLYRRALSTIEYDSPEKEADKEEEAEPEIAPEAAVVAAAGAGENAIPPVTIETEPEAEPEPLREDHIDVHKTALHIVMPRHKPQGVIALTGATILTMEPGAQPITNGVIVIRNDRIESVGDSTTQIPPEAERMDLSGMHILPGYVDTHAHYRPMREVLDRENWSFLANLAYGVTTGLDVQPSTVDILAYEDLIDAGLMPGPRALSTGPGIFNNNEFRSPEHAHAVLSRYKKHYRVHNLKSYIAGSRKQRQWIVKAARELKLMPTTEGALDMKLGLTHAIDGFSGHEHNFPLRTLYPDTVNFVARSGMAYTPTLLVTYGGPWAENWFYTRESPREDAKLKRFTPPQALAARTQRRPWAHASEHVFSHMAAQARKIMRAGGRVGVGAHGQLQGLGYHWELWALASGGFGNMEALRAATLHGAEIIGVAADVGSLRAGKLADLVVLKNNPLQDLRATDDLIWVMKNGALYDAETLAQHWPQKKPAPKPWW